MKVLTLIRHAKSSWDDPTLKDEMRPLHKRGRRDAQAVGKRLAEHDGCPDLIVTSPALRAVATAEIIAEEVGYSLKKIVADDRLYVSNADTLLKVIDELDDELANVFFVSHNPELSLLADRLSLGKVNSIPTCGTVRLVYKTKNWSYIGTKDPKKVRFEQP